MTNLWSFARLRSRADDSAVALRVDRRDRRHLGFQVTYRQVRPNPYVALDLGLHYFGVPGFRPEDSNGSWVVVTDDIEARFDASPPVCEPGTGSFQ